MIKKRFIQTALFILTYALLQGATVAFASEGVSPVHFPGWMAVFFILLLLSIAVFPLINSAWWGKRYSYVTLALAVPAAILVLFWDPVSIIHVIKEYVSFIILLGSLFVISGGISIKTRSQGTPAMNTCFLLLGAVCANFIGTTGASMILIRPLIRANRWRSKTTHVFVFFIFLVSNIGGLLTPLGDPPLFLGFLRGVPFFWTLNLLPLWCFAVAILLTVFFLIDRYFMAKEDQERRLEILNRLPGRRLTIKGNRNFLFLLIVIGAFFLPPVIRETTMIVASGLSIYFTPVWVREENSFTYDPIIEVAVLFAGIFVTMAPVLKILEASSGSLGIDKPWQFFWITGGLSGFLDNAPTYMVFFAMAEGIASAKGLTVNLIAGVPALYLQAISAGAVFMGANSYIGNGPNFMVKAICEGNEVTMPSFFGYMAWSVGILVPLFVVVTLLFF